MCNITFDFFVQTNFLLPILNQRSPESFVRLPFIAASHRFMMLFCLFECCVCLDLRQVTNVSINLFYAEQVQDGELMFGDDD